MNFKVHILSLFYYLLEKDFSLNYELSNYTRLGPKHNIISSVNPKTKTKMKGTETRFRGSAHSKNHYFFPLLSYTHGSTTLRTVHNNNSSQNFNLVQSLHFYFSNTIDQFFHYKKF